MLDVCTDDVDPGVYRGGVQAVLDVCHHGTGEPERVQTVLVSWLGLLACETTFNVGVNKLIRSSSMLVM